MFFVLGNRNDLIRQIPRGLRWAEVGVYRGDFSETVLNICAPEEYLLIDSWTWEIQEHKPFGDTPENFAGFAGKIHWEHFGDDPNGVQEKNYEYVKGRFAGIPAVKVIRAMSVEAIQMLPDRHFDVMYIDANHQYEYVLRDMMEARNKLKLGGLMLMNDFYEGPGGAEQNLGVIGAVNAFVKRHDFHYVAMTYGSFADVALTDDPGSELVQAFLENLKNSELHFIGLPENLVPNIRYKLYRKANGELRYLPLL